MYAFTVTDRQDLFQEIVIQLWNSYPNFKAQSKFSTWLYRVAINTAITQLRKKRNIIHSFDPSVIPEHADVNNSREQEEQLQLMYTGITKLNEIEKAIVMLYMEDKSYEEMEDILGMSQGSLRVKMTRIKDKLRTLTKTS